VNNRDLNIEVYDNESEDYFDYYNIAFEVGIDNYLCSRWKKDNVGIKMDSLVDNVKNLVLFFTIPHIVIHNNCFFTLYHNVLSF